MADRERTVPTVAIDMDGTKVIINKSDFDSENHILWKEHQASSSENDSEKEEEKENGKLPLKRRVTKKK